MIRALVIVVCLLFCSQEYTFAASKTKSQKIEQKQLSKQSIDERYELAKDIKRLYVRAFGKKFYVAPFEEIKINYKTGCGYIHTAILNISVFRLKEDPTYYEYIVSGQVDTNPCMGSNMVDIFYRTEKGKSWIDVEEIAAKEKNIILIEAYPAISAGINNNLSTDMEGKLYLLSKKSLYYKMNEAGDQWSRVAENVQSFAVDKKNNKIIYIMKEDKDGVNYSIQKSLDGGQKWIEITQKDEYREIIINPHNSQEVFLLTNSCTHKTTDAGFSWEVVAPIPKYKIEDVGFGDVTKPTPMTCLSATQLLIHPKEKDTYYALSSGLLITSRDAGLNWSDMSDTLPKRVVKGKGRTATKEPIDVKSITFSDINGSSLLALTNDNGILRTDNNGATWKEVNRGFNKEDGAYSFYTTDSGVYIGSYGKIYFLKKGTDEWAKIDLEKSPEPATAINGIYPLPSEGEDQFIITDLDRLHYVSQERDLIGLNYGVMPHSKINYVKTVTIEGKPRIFAHVQNSNYTDLSDYGLFISDDYGKTWQKSLVYEKPYYGDDPEIFQSPHNEKEIWYYAREGSFWFTLDGGTTWKQYDVWPFTNNKLRCFVFDPTDPKTKYACAGGSLFVNKNSSQTWTEINTNATNLLIAVKDDKKSLLTDKLDLSLDGGWMWNNINPNLKSICESCRLFLFSPEEIILFKSEGLGSYPFNSYSNYLMSSKDNGNTWEKIFIGVNEYMRLDAPLLFVNPHNNNNFFRTQCKKKEVLVQESADRGRTWNQIYSYELTKNNDREQITSIAIANEDVGRAIYLGTREGLLKSTDGGLNWIRLGGIHD